MANLIDRRKRLERERQQPKPSLLGSALALTGLFSRDAATQPAPPVSAATEPPVDNGETSTVEPPPEPVAAGNNLLARRARATVSPPVDGSEDAAAPVIEALTVSDYAGKLEQYRAFVSAALSTMAPMPAMGEERTRYKRQALEQLLPFVKAYMDGGMRYPNDVAVYAMIWAFDVGEIETATLLGVYLINTGVQLMPKKFDRDLPTFVCDSVYDWAGNQLKAGSPAAPYLDGLIHYLEGSKGAVNLHPAVISKLYAMAAKHAERTGDYAAVVSFCKQAEAVNPEKAGVKTLLEAALKKVQPPAEPAA